MEHVSTESVGYTTNTATLVRNGEQCGVNLLIQTSIIDENRRRVLIGETLRAAGLAEHNVRCMSEEDVMKHIGRYDNSIRLMELKKDA